MPADPTGRNSAFTVIDALAATVAELPTVAQVGALKQFGRRLHGLSQLLHDASQALSHGVFGAVPVVPCDRIKNRLMLFYQKARRLLGLELCATGAVKLRTSVLQTLPYPRNPALLADAAVKGLVGVEEALDVACLGECPLKLEFGRQASKKTAVLCARSCRRDPVLRQRRPGLGAC